MKVSVKRARLVHTALTKKSKNVKNAVKKSVEQALTNGDRLRELIADLESQTERLNRAIQRAWFKEFRNSKDFRKATTHIDRAQRRLRHVIKKLNRKRK